MHREDGFYNQNNDQIDILEAWEALSKTRLVELKNGTVKGVLWQDIKNVCATDGADSEPSERPTRIC